MTRRANEARFHVARGDDRDDHPVRGTRGAADELHELPEGDDGLAGLRHAVKGFGIVSKAEIDVFLEISCFFHDPVDVGNLISGSSAFSKTSLNIRKFTGHILLKPGLENFEHYFTSM